MILIQTSVGIFKDELAALFDNKQINLKTDPFFFLKKKEESCFYMLDLFVHALCISVVTS